MIASTDCMDGEICAMLMSSKIAREAEQDEQDAYKSSE